MAEQDRSSRAFSAVNALHLPLLTALLNSGVSANTADEEGATLLMAAALRGWPDGVRLLLARGADANAQDSRGMTPLAWAAEAAAADVARILLAAGTDPRVPDSRGVTPLQRAEERLRMYPLFGGRHGIRLPLWAVRHPLLDVLRQTSHVG